MKSFKKLLSLTVALILLLCICPASAFAKEDFGISELCNIRGEYTDKLGNEYNYFMALPKIHGDTKYVKQANEEIDLVYSRIKNSLSLMADGLSLYIARVWWVAEEYNGITSVIIASDTLTDDVNYLVYNFDEDGKQVKNEDLLKACGLTEKEFVSRAYDVLDQYMTKDDFGGNLDMKKDWATARAETLSEMNCNAKMPIFLLSDGSIIFETTCRTIAGAGYYDHLFVLKGEKEMSKSMIESLEGMGCIIEGNVTPAG